MERPGETAGTVSGTALDVVYVRLLQLGDPGGHARRAFSAFDAKFGTDLGRKICDRYFIEGGKAPDARFRSAPMQVVRSEDGKTTFGAPNGVHGPTPLKFDDSIIELLIATGFAEVWLAKEGHNGKIFINFLNKIDLPLIYIMYGAMLAGVDGVIVGAGNPDGLPAIRSSLASHQDGNPQPIGALCRTWRGNSPSPSIPSRLRTAYLPGCRCERPAFLAIASLEELVKALAESDTKAPDGFIIEHHTAGGHNANPVGPLKKDEEGQPIYGERDEAEPGDHPGRWHPRSGWPAAMAATPDCRMHWPLGAFGVQVGSTFALAEESGMKPEYRTAILKELRNGTDDAALVKTTIFSPTGFSFKVVQLKDTLSDDEVYEARRRICDIGLLQQRGFSKPDEDGTRTLFQRCAGRADR